MSNFLSCLCLQLHCMKSYDVKWHPRIHHCFEAMKKMAALKICSKICAETAKFESSENCIDYLDLRYGEDFELDVII